MHIAFDATVTHAPGDRRQAGDAARVPRSAVAAMYIWLLVAGAIVVLLSGHAVSQAKVQRDLGIAAVRLAPAPPVKLEKPPRGRGDVAGASEARRVNGTGNVPPSPSSTRPLTKLPPRHEPRVTGPAGFPRMSTAMAAKAVGATPESASTPQWHELPESLLVAGEPHRPPIAGEPRCDPYRVPFVDAAACESLLRDASLWTKVEPMAPKFEQRTIKFRVTLRNGRVVRPAGVPSSAAEAARLPDEVEAILKVPQMLFPTEPFSEVSAYAIERMLGVGRVPPTVLVAVPLDRLMAVADAAGAKVAMVPEFNDRKMSWPEWVRADVYDWLRRAKHEHFMPDANHVWCSLQLVVSDVVPLLSSPLKLPYSKAKPGWHRWFNPDWSGFAALRKKRVSYASLLATSELALMDFVLLNNDRSPNKNNFVMKGCLVEDGSGTAELACQHSEVARARRGLPWAYAHLDQGMALNGFPHPHNPVAKPHNNTFCWFFRPLVDRVRRVVERHSAAGGDTAALADAIRGVVPPAVIEALGPRKVGAVARQLPKLLDKAVACVAKYGKEVALPDARSFTGSRPKHASGHTDAPVTEGAADGGGDAD